MGTELKNLIKSANVDTNFPFKEIITDYVFDLSKVNKSEDGEVFYTINWGHTSTTADSPFIAPSENLEKAITFEKAITLVINQLNNTIATPFVKATGDQIPLVSFNFISKSNLINKIDSVTEDNFENLVTEKNNTYVITPEDGRESTDTTLVGNYNAPGNMYFVQYPSSEEETYHNAAEATKTAFELNDVMNGKINNRYQSEILDILITGAKITTHVGENGSITSMYDKLITDINTWYNKDSGLFGDESMTTKLTNEDVITMFKDEYYTGITYDTHSYSDTWHKMKARYTNPIFNLINDYRDYNFIVQFTKNDIQNINNYIRNFISATKIVGPPRSDGIDSFSGSEIDYYLWLKTKTFPTDNKINANSYYDTFYTNLIEILNKIAIYTLYDTYIKPTSISNNTPVPEYEFNNIKPSAIENKQSLQYLMYVENYKNLLALKEYTTNNNQEQFNAHSMVSKMYGLISTILSELSNDYPNIDVIQALSDAKQGIYSYVKDQTYTAFVDITFDTNVFNLWRNVYFAGIKAANKSIQKSLLSYSGSEVIKVKAANKINKIKNKLGKKYYEYITLHTLGFYDDTTRISYVKNNPNTDINIKEEMTEINTFINGWEDSNNDVIDGIQSIIKYRVTGLTNFITYLQEVVNEPSNSENITNTFKNSSYVTSDMFDNNTNILDKIIKLINLVLSGYYPIFNYQIKNQETIMSKLNNIKQALTYVKENFTKPQLTTEKASLIKQTIENLIKESNVEDENLNSILEQISTTTIETKYNESEQISLEATIKEIYASIIPETELKNYYILKFTPNIIIHPNYSIIGTYRYSTFYYALNKALGLKGLSATDISNLGKSYYDFPFTAMEDQILVQGFKKANIYSNNFFTSFAPLDVYALQQVYGGYSGTDENISEYNVIPNHGFITYSGKNTKMSPFFPTFVIHIPFMYGDNQDRTDTDHEVIYQKIKINDNSDSIYDFYYVQLRTNVMNGTIIKNSSYIGAFIVNANTQIEDAFHGVKFGAYYDESHYDAIYLNSSGLSISNNEPIATKNVTIKNIANVTYPAENSAESTSKNSEIQELSISGNVNITYGNNDTVDTSGESNEVDYVADLSMSASMGGSLAVAAALNIDFTDEANETNDMMQSQNDNITLHYDNMGTLAVGFVDTESSTNAVETAASSTNDTLTKVEGYASKAGVYTIPAGGYMDAINENWTINELIDKYSGDIGYVDSGSMTVTTNEMASMKNNQTSIQGGALAIGVNTENASNAINSRIGSLSIAGVRSNLVSATLDNEDVQVSMAVGLGPLTVGATFDATSYGTQSSNSEKTAAYNVARTLGGGASLNVQYAYAPYANTTNNGGSELGLPVSVSFKPNMNNTQTTLNIINATSIRLNGQDVDLQQQKASYAYGTIRLRDTDWTTITYKDNAKFDNPVLILGDPTYKDTQYVIPRIRNVGPSSFEARFVPASNDPVDTHTPEIIPYIVAEKGSTITIGSMKLHFNTFETSKVARNNDSTFETIDISSLAFTETPTLLTQIQTDNHKYNNKSVCMNTRTKSIDTTLFEAALQPEELLLDTLEAVKETVGYLVVTTGSDTSSNGTQVVANTFSNQNFNAAILPFPSSLPRIPITITKISSYKDSNSCNYRVISNSNIGICGFIQEDTSKDAERVHTQDDMSYIAFA